MSSAQDVRFSDAKVQQGRDLANKLWNASRLILINTQALQEQAPAGVSGSPAPRPARAEDRWILSRLQHTIGVVTARLDAYELSHAALELYRFFWSEFCDWYLEIVKPRLYEGEPEASANLLHVLEQFLALAHPVIPFVTEEIWGYLPGKEGTPLIVASYPIADENLRDPEAEAEIEASIELTRGIRRWRDLAGVPVASVLPARVAGEAPHELVARLARLDVDGAGGEALASIGPLELLATDDVDPHQVRARIEARAAELRAEVERGERKLANEGFVAKAPADVVEAEREKLEGYRRELAELEG
jgi:valyl-tRNA synthetase